MTDFRQIASILNWNDKMYVSLFYWELKNEIKDELVKIEWSNDLDDMIKIAVWIDNWLWKRQQEKRIMFSLWQKETSSQEMQNSTESNKKISRNTNENNHSDRTMQKRMISKHEMSTASFKTKLS